MNAKFFVRRIPLKQLKFVIQGVLVGLLGGLVLDKAFYTYAHENPYLLILAAIFMILIGCMIGWLIKGEKNIKGSGIPQVKGQIQGDLELNWWPVLWRKFIGGICSIGPGTFLGREGPSIQLGATVGQGINQFTGGDSTNQRY